MFGRKRIAMVLAEFLGTAILTTVVLVMSRYGTPFFTAIAAGLVLVAMTFVLGPISGSHLNPAVTLGLWSARRVRVLPSLIYIGAQLLGGISAYLLFTYFAHQHWANSTAAFDGHVMVAEVVGTFVFCLGWAAATYYKLDAGKAAAAIGVSFGLGILIASVASAGLLNPAVALGARFWVLGTYVLGPILGAVIAFNLYALFFAPGENLLDKAEASTTLTAKKSSSKKK